MAHARVSAEISGVESCSGIDRTYTGRFRVGFSKRAINSPTLTRSIAHAVSVIRRPSIFALTHRMICLTTPGIVGENGGLSPSAAQKSRQPKSVLELGAIPMLISVVQVRQATSLSASPILTAQYLGSSIATAAVGCDPTSARSNVWPSHASSGNWQPARRATHFSTSFRAVKNAD